ncbi:unnamed protein product, partial [Effrenium voratum]
ALTELLELTEQISGPRVIPYRRLYFESQTLALSDMKQRLERRDDQAPRKMCLPERVQRLKLARDELTGITIDAAFEPSHRLTDICLQQCEDQSISYIELHDCTSREWEISNRKRDSAIEFQVDGTLRMTKKEQRVHHEPTGEHKIRTAMLRRALAYHLVGAASYQVLERAITKLFSYLSREPVRGFRAVSLQQIVFAEKQMWIEASLATVGKVLDTAAPKPLNEAITAAMDSPEVTQGEGLSVRIQCYEFHLPFDWRQMKPVDWSQPVDQLFAVELFAGTAGLSAEMQRQHFQVLPIDHSRSRGPKVKLVLLDVTKPQQFQILLQLLMTANIAYFHAAPPCGFAGEKRAARAWAIVSMPPLVSEFAMIADVELDSAAQGARHPVDVVRLVPDQLTNSVLQVLRMGPKLTNLKRRLSLAKIKRLRIQLAAEEVRLHAKLDPDVECILQGKNLLLWKKLLEESGYKDLSIWDEVVRGVKMTGPASLSEEMPHGYQVPNMSEREVQAKERDPELDAELWKQTLLEVEKGWLQGPFSEEEVTALVGTSSWLATRRFPLRQKTKVRIIDDGLESGLNASYSTPNKLRLHDLDTLTALLIRRCLAGKGRQTVAMADGSLRTAELAADWPAEVDLLGRCLDLTDAYKQLAVDPKEAWSRVLVAYDPERKEPRFFLTRALMFGSSASVYSFNRVSRSLWHLGQFFLWQWSTNYYDDYPSIETRETAGSARETMEGLLEELGWRFAKEGKKAKPYCDSFEVLGVVCSLRGTSVSLANKPSRVEAIVANSEAWVRSGWISPGEAASMHGVLNFAKGHFQGRALEPAAKFLSQIAAGGCKEADRELLPEVVSYLHAVVRGSRPREFGIHDDCRPMLVFTDGAFEPDAEQKYGAGAVLWDTASQRGSSHSVVVPPDLVAAWQSAGKRQLISELEMLPVLSVCESAADMLWRRRVLLFCDNNGVRQMLAKGNTPCPGLFAMLALVHRALAKAECLPWFCRVPSKSNPADGPSRNYWQDEVCAAQCLRGPDFTIPPALVSALLSRQTFLSFLNAESTL